jgi:hypothetical protein
MGIKAFSKILFEQTFAVIEARDSMMFLNLAVCSKP